MDLNELQKNACCGDAEAEKQLFQHLTSRFRLFAKRSIWNEEDCEEIVQETLMTISIKYKEIDFTTSFIGWAHQVLQNKILNFDSKTRRQANLLRDSVSAKDSMQTVAKDHEFEQSLINCMKKINKKNNRYARAINLSYQGFAVEEICEKLGLSKSNFYSILSRARSLLLLCLKKGELE